MIRSIFCIFFCLALNLYGNGDFDYLEGKDLDHWKYLQNSEDIAALQTFRSVYEQRKNLQYQNAKNYRIPPILHIIWLGPKSFPIKSMTNLISWKKFHPDWKIWFWTDRKRIINIENIQFVEVSKHHFSKCYRQYMESNNWAEKSDILRYEILLKHGGVYADHDALCLQSFEKLNKNYDFYGCLEVPHAQVDDRALTIGIGLIGAKEKHPMILGALEYIENEWDSVTKRFLVPDRLTQAERVMHRSYVALTHSSKKYFNQNGNVDIVFPASYFFAIQNLPSIYSKHMYATSWNFYSEETTSKLLHSKLKKPRKKQSQLFILETVIACLSIFSLGLSIWIFRKVKRS